MGKQESDLPRDHAQYIFLFQSLSVPISTRENFREKERLKELTGGVDFNVR